jgi:small subunit ribosomal protein S3
MGQKTNPIAFRLGVVKDWKSRWFSRKNLGAFLEEDYLIRTVLEERLARASVESIDIVRSGNTVSVTVRSARPGLIIGRGGKGLEELQTLMRRALEGRARRRGNLVVRTIKLEIEEIRRPEMHARLVAKSIAEQLERRIPFRRVLKQTLEKVMQQKGVEGVKITVAGRLEGAEIARTETMSRGKIPLATLRADIDYAPVEARTTYGVIGIKVWLYRGEVFKEEPGVK